MNEQPDRTVATTKGVVRIRPARVEDATAFRDLRLEALRSHPNAFSADYKANLSRLTTYWTERLAFDNPDSSDMIYFAEHDQQLVGMCGVFRQNSPKIRHSATIWGMYVRPDWRGFHIAEALVTACVEWARKMDVRIVKLAVVTTNTAAIRCYGRCGFQVYGVEPRALLYDGIYYDELLMARAISGGIDD